MKKTTSEIIKQKIFQEIEKFKFDSFGYLLKVVGYSIAFIIVPILPFYLYWNKFGSFNLSTEFSDWVNFGTYLGGVLPSILAIVNIYVLYQLTKTAKNIDEKNLTIQLSKDAYNQLKNKIDVFFEKSLENLHNNEDPNKNVLLASKLRIFISTFVADQEFLFPGLKDNEATKKILKNLKEYMTNNDINVVIPSRSEFLRTIQKEFLKIKGH